MHKSFIPYQMKSLRPLDTSHSAHARKRQRLLPALPIPISAYPPKTSMKSNLSPEIIPGSPSYATRPDQGVIPELVGLMEGWKKVAEENEREMEKWRSRALELAQDQDQVGDGEIDALEDCWTNLRTVVGYENEGVKRPTGSWECYVNVRNSRRYHMERRLVELGRQVRDLERKVESLKVSRYSPYFGSMIVEDDDTPPQTHLIPHQEALYTEDQGGTIFINELFPELAIETHVGVGVDVDIHDVMPPTPISIFGEPSPDFDQYSPRKEDTKFDFDCDLGLANAPLGDGLPPTPNSMLDYPTLDLDLEFDPAPTTSSSSSSTPSSSKVASLFVTSKSAQRSNIVKINESLSRYQIYSPDSEGTRPRPRLKGLGDWARDVLMVLETDQDGVEMEHLEWTWGLIEHFQSCISKV